MRSRNGLPLRAIHGARLIREGRGWSIWDLELVCGHTLRKHRRNGVSHRAPGRAACIACERARLESLRLRGKREPGALARLERLESMK